MDELEQVDKVEKLRRQKLDDLPPNTKHPFCPCKRSWNEHLQDDILACQDIRELMSNFNVAPLISHARVYGEFDETYLLYAVKNLYRESPEEQRELLAAVLMRKISITMGSRLKMFYPFNQKRDEEVTLVVSTGAPWHNGALN